MMMENFFINNNNDEDNNNLLLLSSPVSANFRVIFFDGEREHDKGLVNITPSLTFKEFQSILRKKLDTSPHQITIYFERHHNNLLNHHHRRRHPVTSKFDFGSIIPESNTSFFWVVQKRSRRTRRRKPKMEGFTLLRRSHDVNSNNHGYVGNYNNYGGGNYNVNELEYLRMMQIERDRYLMSMDLNSNVYDDLSSGYCFFPGHYGNFSDDGASSSGGGSSIEYNNNNNNNNHSNRGGAGGGGFGYCEVCYSNAVRGETAPFHCCKNDVVTQIFRSPAGPIGPPNKRNEGLG